VPASMKRTSAAGPGHRTFPKLATSRLRHCVDPAPGMARLRVRSTGLHLGRPLSRTDLVRWASSTRHRFTVRLVPRPVQAERGRIGFDNNRGSRGDWTRRDLSGRTSYMLAMYAYHGFARWLPPSRGPLGHVFRAIRVATGGRILGHAGRPINLERGANIGRGRHITLGDRSAIGINASLHGPVHIGSDVMMGPDVMIFALGHATARTDVPMVEQGYIEPSPVVIEDDVWIGARAILLPGITIGHGSIIGAGAVVSRSIPPLSVAVGNPARVVKTRQSDGE
jgi:maltose O-acetyltransferase